MRAVLVDSDIVIEVLRARNSAMVARWKELSRSDALILCSPATIAELWHGVRPSEEKSLHDLFAALTCIPIDGAIGKLAGDYLRQYAKSHNVELGDALIAATAVMNNTELWTRNHRHYPMEEIAFY